VSEAPPVKVFLLDLPEAERSRWTASGKADKPEQGEEVI
jgi:hypothetical protein